MKTHENHQPDWFGLFERLKLGWCSLLEGFWYGGLGLSGALKDVRGGVGGRSVFCS